MLTRANVRSKRNIMIVGFEWIQQHALTLSPLWRADILSSILRTGMAVGGMSAVVFDHLLSGTAQELGSALR